MCFERVFCGEVRVARFAPGRSLAQTCSLNVEAAEGSVAENCATLGTGSSLQRFCEEAMCFYMLMSIAAGVEGLVTDLTRKSIALHLGNK